MNYGSVKMKYLLKTSLSLFLLIWASQTLAVTNYTFVSQSLAVPIYKFDFTGEDKGIARSFGFVQGDIELNVSAWISNFNSAQVQLNDWTPVNPASRQSNGGSALPSLNNITPLTPGIFNSLGSVSTNTNGQDPETVGVSQSEDGLGVVSSENDSDSIDGGSSGDFLRDPDEGILLLFSEPVTLIDVGFSEVGDDDDVNLAIADVVSDDEIESEDVFVDRGRPGTERDVIFGLTSNPTGTAFLLFVDGNDDDVFLSSISVAKVPEPGSLVLLVTALFGLIVVRKKL